MMQDLSLQYIVRKLQFGIRRSIAMGELLAVVAVVCCGVSCSEFASIGTGSLGGECMLDSDCQGTLICAYQFCHIPCNKTEDCDVAGGEECLVGHEDSKLPYNYCSLPILCTKDVQCGNSRVCGDGICRDKCVDDNDCLGDQRCFHGGCRNKDDEPIGGWDTPAKLGELCAKDSDCESRKCNWEGHCIGCAGNFDCGPGRTCNTMGLDGKGMCSGDPASVSGSGSPIVESYVLGDDTWFNVIDAVPDSTGNFVYFIAKQSETAKNGVFRIRTDGSSFCTIFDDPSFSANRIVISGDDNTLFVNQTWPYDPAKIGGISTLDLSFPLLCQPSTPQTLPWSGGLIVSAMDIHAEGNSHVFNFVAQDTQDPAQPVPGLWSGSINERGPLLATVGSNYGIDLGFGMSPMFILSKLYQLGEFDAKGEIFEIEADVGMGASSLALSHAEDVVYISAGDKDGSHILAIEWSNSMARQSDTIEHPLPPITTCNPGPCWPPPKLLKFRTPSRVNRAMQKDIFSWVSGNGELHVFTPQ